MKSVIVSLLAVFAISAFAETAPTVPAAAPQTKKVCKETKDAKTQAVKQQCKTIRIHKKLDVAKSSDVKSAK